MLELTNFVSTLFLTGLIWTIQMVHYPSFAFIDPQKATLHSQFHQRSISYVVMPLMIVELLTGLSLWIQDPSSVYFLALLFFIILIWLSTFFLSVPLHGKLLQRVDPNDVRMLVLTNWPRTFLWTLRSMLLIYHFAVLEYSR